MKRGSGDVGTDSAAQRQQKRQDRTKGSVVGNGGRCARRDARARARSRAAEGTLKQEPNTKGVLGTRLATSRSKDFIGDSSRRGFRSHPLRERRWRWSAMRRVCARAHAAEGSLKQEPNTKGVLETRLATSRSKDFIGDSSRRGFRSHPLRERLRDVGNSSRGCPEDKIGNR